MPETDAREKTVEEKGLRVSCTACGHFLLRLTHIPKEEPASWEQMCRKCHRTLSVSLVSGKVSVALL